MRALDFLRVLYWRAGNKLRDWRDIWDAWRTVQALRRKKLKPRLCGNRIAPPADKQKEYTRYADARSTLTAKAPRLARFLLAHKWL